ncbi:MAG: wax ester/triacylglycerol synthase family O-acyltransferase [Mycobacterium sp.]|nr:wax ester/triacylglycerol synthase family O-acyltransferase [Mycobacterium sp.]
MESLETLDSLMLAGEKLGSAMHVGVVLILSPPAEAAEAGLKAYVDKLYEDSLIVEQNVDPRLRRHPHRGADTGGIWVWREVPEIDLRAHVHRVTLTPGSGPADLWEMVSELHGGRLDMSVPMWTSYLIDGLPDGRFALYIKIHHTIIDGVAGLRMISDSLSPDPEKRWMPPFYAEKKTAGTPAKKSRPKRPSLPGPFQAVRAVADAAAAGLDLTRRVAEAELANILGSLVTDTVVAPFEAPQTRFNAKLGPRRAAAGTSLDRERVRAIQKATGATGNDVITTLIAGAMRAWLLERDQLPDRTLVAMCPVSVRDREIGSESHGHDSGNKFGLGLCPLGTDIADPAERLAFVQLAMTNIKKQVTTKGSDAMLAVMGPAIGSTVMIPLLPFGTLLPPSCNMAISNVPGPREEMYYNGAHLDEIYPVSSIFDGMGLNVTVCSYAGRIAVGYVTDADVMPRVGELIPLTEQALTELETAVGLAAN